MIDKIYILCNINEEPDRYSNILNQIKQLDIDQSKIEFFNYCWSSDITLELYNFYCKTHKSQEISPSTGISTLSKQQISLFLNYIECLKKIKNTNSNGNFIILESDIIFYPKFIQNLNSILESINNIPDWDIINLGNGVFRLFGNEFPKTQPVTLNNFHFYKENRNVCMECILWNYNSVCKIIEHFEKDNDINGAIDVYIDALGVLSNDNNLFNIYWCSPSLGENGSITGRYKSLLINPLYA